MTAPLSKPKQFLQTLGLITNKCCVLNIYTTLCCSRCLCVFGEWTAVTRSLRICLWCSHVSFNTSSGIRYNLISISSALLHQGTIQCAPYYLVTLHLLHYGCIVARAGGHVGAQSRIPLIEDTIVMEELSWHVYALRASKDIGDVYICILGNYRIL